MQANVDQANKWRPENSLEIFEDYLKLTRTGGAAPGLAGITLVIWPETAVPFLLGDTAEALTSIAETLPEGTSLLVGSPRVAEERDAAGALLARRVYNSLFVIDDRGVIREDLRQDPSRAVRRVSAVSGFHGEVSASCK